MPNKPSPQVLCEVRSFNGSAAHLTRALASTEWLGSQLTTSARPCRADCSAGGCTHPPRQVSVESSPPRWLPRSRACCRTSQTAKWGAAKTTLAGLELDLPCQWQPGSQGRGAADDTQTSRTTRGGWQSPGRSWWTVGPSGSRAQLCPCPPAAGVAQAAVSNSCRDAISSHCVSH